MNCLSELSETTSKSFKIEPFDMLGLQDFLIDLFPFIMYCKLGGVWNTSDVILKDDIVGLDYYWLEIFRFRNKCT